MLNPPVICGNCRKVQLPNAAMFVMDAAPVAKDEKLAKQLAEEGRGAVLGDLHLCVRCWIGGLPKKIEEAA